MRTITKVLALGGVAVLAISACGSDDDATTSSTTAAQPVTFNVNLSGIEEVPGPGDGDGIGAAMVTVTPGTTDVCTTMTVDNVDEVIGAHIHEGRNGTAGPIAVTLMAPTEGSSEGCVETSGSIVDALATGTRSFYINVHTNDYPDGAVRAQLTTA
jgi:hypothetical protein